MSYKSTNILSENISISKVESLVELLGYERVKNHLKIPNLISSYFWYDYKNYMSFVGIELCIYKKNRVVTVETRSRIGRSYWDLEQQNKTIKLLREYFGGSFSTDEGKNRYMQNDKEPPTKLESGLFISRWIYNNALIKPKIYLNSRNIEDDIGRHESSGIEFLDQMNPRLFSNNLLIPYFVAAWENYLKSSFIVLLKSIDSRDKILKNVRLTVDNLKNISSGIMSVEEAIAEVLSFQRPRIIAENFKALDDKIDLYSVLKKPYRNRKISLFDSIEAIIDLRNEFVHTGSMNTDITDKKIKSIMSDFEVAVDRIYSRFGEYYKFIPSREF
jgi:hypothetical protein